MNDAMPGLDRDLKFHPIENANPRTLSREQIRRYNEQGYVLPIDVFSDSEIASHRAYLTI